MIAWANLERLALRQTVSLSAPARPAATANPRDAQLWREDPERLIVQETGDRAFATLPPSLSLS